MCVEWFRADLVKPTIKRGKAVANVLVTAVDPYYKEHDVITNHYVDYMIFDGDEFRHLVIEDNVASWVPSDHEVIAWAYAPEPYV